MAALEDVLGRYNQSNFDIGGAAAEIRKLGQQVGLTDAELAAAVPIFGDEHRAALNSGYTEGSNYAAIAQRAVSDAMKTKGQNTAQFDQATQNYVQQGAQQAQQRWQATQEDDGGLFGDLGPLAQLAALIPGPQQPFLLGANALNAASQGNWIGAGLNAFGAYSGGWDGLTGGGGGLGADTAAFEAGGAGGLQNWGNLGADTAAFEAGGAGGLQDWGTLSGNLGGVGGSGLSQAEMDALVSQAQQEIATGAAGSVGVNSAGSASWIDQLVSNPGSALSKLVKAGGASLLGGGGSLLGNIGTGIAGLYGAKVAGDQTDAYKEMAEKYAGYGAPYRQRLSDLYANPSGFLQSQEVQKPVQMGTDMLMRSLSTQGNPFGSGNALQQGQSYASDQLFSRLGQEKDRLGGFGGLTAYNQAAPQASQNAIASMSNAPNVIGATASSIFNPQPTFAETWKQFQTLSGR